MDQSVHSAPRWSRKGKIVAIASPPLLALVYIVISLISANVLTHASNHKDEIAPQAIGADAKVWSTRTSDGITLRGLYLPTPEHRNLIVLVHGMGSSRDEMAGLGRDLHARGFDILLFDLRGHGESDPSRLSMGRNERKDLRAVLAWAKHEGYTPDRIGWLGYSMGAATILMEGAVNPDFRVAILDSPFGDLPDLLNSQLPKHSHLPKFFNPGILFAAHRAYGIRTDDIRPARSASDWRGRPILLIHGEADTTVPVRQSREIARTLGSSCTLVTLPGVEHVEAYRSNPKEYVDRAQAFFNKHLGK
jgi:alpha-beta hydrolase superfamily lysophospholipase